MVKLLSIGLTVLTVSAVGVAIAAGQTDDFNDGNDDGWTRLDPLGEFVGSPVVSFQVVNGEYRISSGPSPNPGGLGQARAASMRQDRVYGDFCVAVDIVGFNAAQDLAIGLLARVQPNPSLGTTDGYALTCQEDENEIEISLVTDEDASSISPAVELSAPFDPARDYRLVFAGQGPILAGMIFDKANLAQPLAMAIAIDATYASGTCGVVLVDNSSGGGGRMDATFDNYHATDGTPPPLEVRVTAFDEAVIAWPDTALCHVLDRSTLLTPESWQLFPGTIFHTDGQFRVQVDPRSPDAHFYRLRFAPGETQ